MEAGQPPTRCSLIDSPTTTQAESETQLTADSDWGDGTTAGPCQGSPAWPVRMISPAVAEVLPVLPTATQVSMAVQDTSDSEADDGVTAWVVHAAPPLSDVSSTPRPDRVLFTPVAVVPTTVHRTPATPTVGAGEVVVVVGATVVVVVVGAPTGAEPGVELVAAAAGAAAAAVTVVVGSAPLPEGAPAMHETPLR